MTAENTYLVACEACNYKQGKNPPTPLCTTDFTKGIFIHFCALCILVTYYFSKLSFADRTDLKMSQLKA